MSLEVPATVWPHTVRNELPKLHDIRGLLHDRSDLNKDYMKVLRRTVMNIVPGWLGLGRITEINQQDTMAFVNGENSKPIADKYQFIEMVNALGYRAPKQRLIKANEQIANVVETLSDFGDTVLIKPRKGAQGGGVRVVGKKQAEPLIQNQKDDLIVQELVSTTSEYRYVWLNEEERKLRLCFERVLPRVIGDGKSSIQKLLQKSDDIPPVAKAINTYRNRKRLNTIPSNGDTVTLSHVANIPSGGYEKYPDEKIIPNIDRFFEQFINDLQSKHSLNLLLLSFDFGVIDSSVLEGEYDFEKMKQNVVFFESQMPFGFEGYTMHIPNASIRDKIRTEIGFLGEIIKTRNKKT